MFDYCGRRFLDDAYLEDEVERVANVKRIILQFIGALENLAKYNIYFELLRPENIRISDIESDLYIMDIPYLLDTKEDQIGFGYQNESSSPETLQELVYSPEKSISWSVGLTLFRLLYKKYPFTGKIFLIRIRNSRGTCLL